MIAVVDVPPVISVTVPTRGRAEHVRDCISSILACIGPAFEVIVVDQSDDRTTEQRTDGRREVVVGLEVLRLDPDHADRVPVHRAHIEAGATGDPERHRGVLAHRQLLGQISRETGWAPVS